MKPSQITDDFSSRQYFQQANQVMLTRDRHNFYKEDHQGHTDLCFGLLTGYPCRTCNRRTGRRDPPGPRRLFNLEDHGVPGSPLKVNSINRGSGSGQFLQRLFRDPSENTSQGLSSTV